MIADSTGGTDDAVEQFTRPVVKLLLGLIGLFVLRLIVTNLPGLGTDIPGAPISFATVAAGLITLVMVGIIANFGREIEPRINQVLSGPATVVRDLSQAIKHIIFLVALVLAYGGLSPVVVPFLFPDPGPWVYDVVFLLIALGPTLIIAQRMYTNLEDLTDVLTRQVKSATVNNVNCSSCGEEIRASLDFCPSCGEEVMQTEHGQTHQSMGSSRTSCPNCSADIEPAADFCGSCGTDLAD